MNDILTGDKLIYFSMLFVPGFISLKIYDMLIPTEKRDFSKSWYDAVGYSVLNFAALSPVMFIAMYFNFPDNHPILFGLTLIVMLLIFPILWPFLMRWVQSRKVFSKHTIHPIAKPWDYVFGQKKPYWIIVNLKDGTQIAGKYYTKSFTSHYPAKEQIYLEEAWTLDDNGVFQDKIERTAGIIVMGDDIMAVELYEYEGGETNVETEVNQ